MRLRGLGQGEGRADAELQLALLDPGEAWPGRGRMKNPIPAAGARGGGPPTSPSCASHGWSPAHGRSEPQLRAVSGRASRGAGGHPPARATLTEERTEPVRMDVRDDVGVGGAGGAVHLGGGGAGLGGFEVEAPRRTRGWACDAPPGVQKNGRAHRRGLEGRAPRTLRGKGRGPRGHAGPPALGREPSRADRAPGTGALPYTVEPGHEAAPPSRPSAPRSRWSGATDALAPELLADLSFPAQDIELEEVDIRLSKGVRERRGGWR